MEPARLVRRRLQVCRFRIAGDRWHEPAPAEERRGEKTQYLSSVYMVNGRSPKRGPGSFKLYDHLL
jgi:hypothetical protein